MEITTALLASLLAAYVMWWPIAWLACAIFSWVVAREKQYNGFAWFLLGVLFGPVTLIATAGLPDRSAPRHDSDRQKLEPALRE
ncbi:MAG: hypothetical protein ITG07_08000 [Candidimonas sp.]|nr:hypothetical protein [Candidimonas sp.]